MTGPTPTRQAISEWYHSRTIFETPEQLIMRALGHFGAPAGRIEPTDDELFALWRKIWTAAGKTETSAAAVLFGHKVLAIYGAQKEAV